jgi:glycosyltransferase involved in cell wall biosynthesis
MKISVIIPTYNRAHLVGETIENVLQQKTVDTEIVVVNDGSTDNTDEVIKRYRDTVVYIRKENGGSSTARNAGAMASRGEWLIFLDDDDRLLPGRLDAIYTAMKCWPQAVAHLCNVVMQIRSGEVELFALRLINQNEEQILVDEPLVYVLKQCSFTCNVAVRRCVFEKVGGFRSDAVYEDWDLLSKCACVGPWVITRKPLVRFQRISGVNNLSERTRANKLKSLLSLTKSHEALLEWCGQHAERRRLVLKSIASVWKGIAVEAVKTDNVETWRNAIKKAVEYEPSVLKKIVAIAETLCGPRLFELGWRIRKRKKLDLVR